MKTLGQRVRELRESENLSLREFAKRLGGLSAAFLSDVELGRRYPSGLVLANMARVLGTTADELKKYDDRPPVKELRQLSTADPAFALAFRKLIDKDVTSQDLLKFLDSQPDRGKKKSRKVS